MTTWKGATAALILTGVMTSSPARAATLVHYDFTGATAGNSAAFTTSAASESLGSASSLTWVGSSNVGNSNSVTNVAPDSRHSTSTSGTLSTGTTAGNKLTLLHAGPTNWAITSTSNYLTFTYAAGAQAVYLESFSLDFAHPATTANDSANRGFVVNYAVDGGSLVEAGWGRILGSGSGNQAANFSFNLATPAAPAGVALAAGKAVEFRVYKTNINGSNNEVRYDNFQLNGALVPEPSVVMLGMLGVGMLLLRRSRC